MSAHIERPDPEEPPRRHPATHRQVVPIAAVAGPPLSETALAISGVNPALSSTHFSV
jgi:hypothetical protein